MIILTFLIGLLADFIKKYYKKDVSYNVKKYMDINKFIFSYDFNSAKSKLDFSGYALIILTLYMVISLFLLDKFVIPTLESNKYFKLLIIIIFAWLVLIMIIISKKLFRYFLGDVGDLKNVDMNKKEVRRKYKDILFILTYYVISYVLLLLYILTMNKIFMVLWIIILISIVPINAIYEVKLEKILKNTKKYYKNTIKLKTIDGIKKYKTSETVIQILSNNDLVIIEDKNNYSYLIRADEIEYIRIEDDLYYLKDGKYQIEEDYFKDKANYKYRKSKNTQNRNRFIRKRKQLDAAK